MLSVCFISNLNSYSFNFTVDLYFARIQQGLMCYQANTQIFIMLLITEFVLVNEYI